ncbi:MAG: hypothetical protein JOY67_03895, partial [Hyphomicrobiales bacterium]|nr:hypothetical protein [Hyphomicrobiales bacterium]
FGERFPTRRVEAIEIDGLPEDAPELVLADKLAAYDALVAERMKGLPPGTAARSRLVLVGLQQRLLSSIAAFAMGFQTGAFDLAHIASAYSAAENGVSPDLPILLGRKPRWLSEFLDDHQNAFSF